MKKIITSSFVVVAFIVMLVSASTAQAQNCNGVVDKVCATFKAMAKQVDNTNSLDAFENINFTRAIQSTGLDKVPDACGNLRLTTADKTKIKAAFKEFYNSTVNKIVSLSGGYMTSAEVEQMLGNMLEEYNRCVDNARTLQDVLDNMNNLDF